MDFARNVNVYNLQLRFQTLQLQRWVPETKRYNNPKFLLHIPKILLKKTILKVVWLKLWTLFKVAIKVIKEKNLP